LPDLADKAAGRSDMQELAAMMEELGLTTY
jgi:hypothetical protein